jgi:hypothetical protein
MALSINYSNPGLPVEYVLDSDPTVFGGWGGTNAELASILYRTDTPSIYRKTGPVNTDWTLQATSAGGTVTFTADFINPEIDPTAPALGNPVTVVASPTPTKGQTSVRTATAGGNALGPQLPNVAGLIIKIDSSASPTLVTVQTSGIVVLTTAQWDVITLGTPAPGGLVQGAIYYLSFGFDDFGHITQSVASGADLFISRVGIALNPTTLLLTIPTQSPTFTGGT